MYRRIQPTWQRVGLSMAVSLLLSPAVLLAQATRQSAPTAVPDDDQPVVLNPFVVDATRDQGYRATNTISGTRLNTPIKNVPVPIEVITEDFIRDIGATNLREALQYSSGIILESQSDFLTPRSGFGGYDDPARAGANETRAATGSRSGTTIKVRGFVTNSVLREGFLRQHSSDSVNIGRIEVVRGPSALLYGVGSFGGIVNYLPKLPGDRLAQAYELEVGTRSFIRSTVDVGAPLGERAGFRVTGAFQKNESERQFYELERFFVSPIVTFIPWDRTRIVADFEYGEQVQKGVGFDSIRARRDGSPDQKRTTVFLTDGTVDPKVVRWSGPDTRHNDDAWNARLNLTHQFTDNLTIQVGYNKSNAQFFSRNVDAGLFNPTAAPVSPPALTRQIPLPTIGQAFGPGGEFGNVGTPQVLPVVIKYAWNDVWDDIVVDQVRTELAYNFDLFRGRHTILLGRQDFRRVAERFHRQTLNGQRGFKAADDFSVFRYATQADGSPNPAMQDRRIDQNRNWDSGHYAIYAGHYWENRIHLIGGARHDRNDSANRGLNLFNNPPIGIDDVTWNYASTVNKGPLTKVSPMFGLTFQINEALSLFGLYSTGLQPNYGVLDGLNNPMPHTAAKSVEAGVKFDLLEGRISGTASVFKIERENAPRGIWWSPKISGLFNPDAQRVTRFDNPGTATNPLTGQFSGTFRDWAIAQNGGTLPDWYAITNPLNKTSGIIIDYTDPNGPGYKYIKEAWRFCSLFGAYGNYPFGQTAGTPVIIDATGQPAVINTAAIDPERAANVAVQDEAKGFDAQLYISPIRNFSTVLSYAYVKRQITNHGQYIKAPYFDIMATWNFPVDSWGTMFYRTVEEAYRDPLDSSTFIRPDTGRADDDTPRHTISMWNRYEWDSGPLKGFAVGLGFTWEDKRPWFSGYTTDGTLITGREGFFDRDNLHKYHVIVYSKDNLTVNGMLEYRHVIAERYPMRYMLSVRNIPDDRSKIGQIYKEERSIRLSARLSF